MKLRYLLALLLLLLPACTDSGAMPMTMLSGSVSSADPDACTGGVDDYIGIKTYGATPIALGAASGLALGIFEAPCTGGLDTAYAYNSGSEATGLLKVGVFLNATGDGIPNDTDDVLVGKSASISYDDSGADHFTAAFSSGSVTKGVKYWLTMYVGSIAWRTFKGTDGGDIYWYDYDDSCDGYNDAISEITYGGVCVFPADGDGYYPVYVTLKVP